jgi:plastocyanin
MKHTVLLALAAAFACAAPVAAIPATAPPPVATVHIKDFAYHANAVTVHVGDAVRFVNDDGDAHTVTASDKSFDSGGLDAGESWTRVFTKPGKYAYFCALHPYMKAIVVVVPAESRP